jgi:hypothetical protein
MIERSGVFRGHQRLRHSGMRMAVKYPSECAQAGKMSRAQGVVDCCKRSRKNRSDIATGGTRGSEKICGREESYTATVNYIARRITRVMVLRGPYGTSTRHSVKILQHGTQYIGAWGFDHLSGARLDCQPNSICKPPYSVPVLPTELLTNINPCSTPLNVSNHIITCGVKT